jgi:dsDNA-binding SOS-regulon protein
VRKTAAVYTKTFALAAGLHFSSVLTYAGYKYSNWSSMMAVVVKYVVVRDGEEKMSFVSKKEADAYDKMLDLAECLTDYLESSPVLLEGGLREELALWLAEHKDELSGILRSGRLPDVTENLPVSVEKKVKVA